MKWFFRELGLVALILVCAGAIVAGAVAAILAWLA